MCVSVEMSDLQKLIYKSINLVGEVQISSSFQNEYAIVDSSPLLGDYVY